MIKLTVLNNLFYLEERGKVGSEEDAEGHTVPLQLNVEDERVRDIFPTHPPS